MKHNFEDLTSQRFERWKVVRLSEQRTSQGSAMWICQCDCGTIRGVPAGRLKNKQSLSCGCLRKEIVKAAKFIDRINETKHMSNGLLAQIIKYNASNDIDVKFENGQIAYNRQYRHFVSGAIKCPLIIKKIDNYCEVMNANTVPASVFLIDTEDVHLLKSCFWQANSKGYICSSNYGQLHRLIMDASIDEQVDHKNGDRNDNRKNNLRLCTNIQNAQNRKLLKNTISGYKGVTWHNSSNMWVSRIGVNGQRKTLGYFRDKIDAAKAYNEAAIKYFGEFAKLNDL